jgi:hypothetical protein
MTWVWASPTTPGLTPKSEIRLRCDICRDRSKQDIIAVQDFACSLKRLRIPPRWSATISQRLDHYCERRRKLVTAWVIEVAP